MLQIIEIYKVLRRAAPNTFAFGTGSASVFALRAVPDKQLKYKNLHAPISINSRQAPLN